VPNGSRTSPGKSFSFHVTRRALSMSRRGRELRQASPLPSILPASRRAAVLEQVSALKKGVILGSKSRGAAAPEAAR
jgi:hypothetical protein